MRPRRLLLALPALCMGALALVSGCWELAALDDREVADREIAENECPNVFARKTWLACQGCLEASCCPELARCHSSEQCMSCATVGGYDCEFLEEFAAVADCVRSTCGSACGRPPLEVPIDGEPYCNELTAASSDCAEVGNYFQRARCNPVSNEGCDTAAGEVCDYDPETLVWDCHSVGHYRSCGEACGLVEGMCAASMVCVNAKCWGLCCRDSDCGGLVGARCVLYDFNDGYVGVCVY